MVIEYGERNYVHFEISIKTHFGESPEPTNKWETRRGISSSKSVKILKDF